MGGGGSMGDYTPAGAALLAISWVAALITQDATTIVSVLALVGLAFGFGVALRQAGDGDEGRARE